MRQQRSEYENIQGHPLCTTIPQHLVMSVKKLAIKKSIRISDIMAEAIEDLLIKYKRFSKS